MQNQNQVNVEEITINTSKLNLFQRINIVQKAVKSVFKGAKVSMGSSGSYNAVSHDDVTALLHDPIANAGIVAFPNMESAEVDLVETVKNYGGKDTISTSYRVKVWASVEFINSDNPQESKVTKCFAYALDNSDKATGKAYSMAIKYCYLKTFMLESLDEEESRDYEHRNRRQQSSGGAGNFGGNANNSQNNQNRTSQQQTSGQHQGQAHQGGSQAAGGGQDSPASAAQVNVVKKFYPEMNLDGLTRAKASELITNYNKNKGSQQ